MKTTITLEQLVKIIKLKSTGFILCNKIIYADLFLHNYYCEQENYKDRYFKLYPKEKEDKEFYDEFEYPEVSQWFITGLDDDDVKEIQENCPLTIFVNIPFLDLWAFGVIPFGCPWNLEDIECTKKFKDKYQYIIEK